MKLLLLLVTWLLAGNVFAQHEDELPLPVKDDTLKLHEAFKKGKVHGHFRYFFMATDNSKGLSDYYANALGGGLKYETAPFKKFALGVGGFFIYNIGSSDLSGADPQTQLYNRYELSLFDMEDPHNKNDIDRLEELYLKYRSGKIQLVFGKQLINTPFINPQDRMRPTEVEGLYGEAKFNSKWKIEGGWIYKISPRSTVKWYHTGRSIGINSQGVNLDGTSGDYAGNLDSKGVGMLGISFKPAAEFKLKLFDQFTENIFNTSLFQAEWEKHVNGSTVSAAFQYLKQDVVNEGGNADPSRTYFDKRNKVNAFGWRMGWQKKWLQATVNYQRITKSGRFTMPREWGTEPFFTQLSRERNEGYGDVHAIMVKGMGRVPDTGFILELAYGHYYLPAVENAVLNKYKMPSYRHLKTAVDYDFDGDLEGFHVSFLYVYKGHLGEKIDDPKYLYNKVDMSAYSLVMNYRF